MEMRWAMRVCAYSSTAERGSVGESRARKRNGELRRGRPSAWWGGAGACSSAIGARAAAMADWSVLGGGIDVPFQGELQRDLHGPLHAAGGHVVDARDGGKLFLQGGGYGRGHCLRAASGESGGHLDRREVHVWQVAHRQEPVQPMRAKNQNTHHDQGRHNRPTDEEARECSLDLPRRSGGRILDLHPRTGNEPELAIGHHLIPGCHPLLDHGLAADSSPRRDGSRLHRWNRPAARTHTGLAGRFEWPERGCTTVSGWVVSVNTTLTNCPGQRLPSRFGNVALSWIIPVPGSTVLLTKLSSPDAGDSS